MKKVQIFIEDKELDLFPDESFSLTFRLDEISDIGTKAASFSQEINIPATENNNRIFTSLFDVNIEGGYNPISKKRALLLVEGQPLMRGYFQLMSINIRDNKFVTYQGLLIEEQVSFLSSLGDLTLSNLSIPITGTTTELVAPYTYVTTFEFTGNNLELRATDQFGVQRFTGLDYTGVTFGSGSYGQITQQNRSYLTMAEGVTWTPATMGAYEASSPQVLEMDINFDLTSIGFTEYIYRVIKSDYNSPLSGLYTDIVLKSGRIKSSQPDPITLVANAKITIDNLYVPLFENDMVRFELFATTERFVVFNGSNNYIKGSVLSGDTVNTTGLTVNAATVLKSTNSVENSDDGKIVFPLNDYSNLLQFEELQSTPSNVTKELNINIENLRPFVFVKHVWDGIFEQSGFKYQSQFLNDDIFKSLIIGGGISDDEIGSVVYHTIPNTASTLSLQLEKTKDTQTTNVNDEVTSYTYKHKHFGDYSLSATGSTANTFTSIVQFEQYSTYAPSSVVNNVKVHSIELSGTNFVHYYGYVTSGTPQPYGMFMTAANDGKYQVDCKLTFTSQTPQYQFNNVSFPTRFILQLQKLSIGSYKYFPNTHTAPTYDNWEVITQSEISRVTNTSGQTHTLNINEELTAKRGDMFRVIIIGDPNLQGFGPTNGITQQINIDGNSGNTYCKFIRKGNSLYGTYDNLAVFLPREMKQKDFILGISKLFNLYFEVDKIDPKKIIIEPRDTYYELGRIINIENRIDKTKDFNISILSHEYPKNQIFKWSEDTNDYFSQKYKSLTENQLQFGSYKYTSPNEYVTEEQTLESVFAPSYLGPIDEKSGIIITKIIDPKTQEPGYDGGEVTYEIKPRIMCYKMKSFDKSGYTIMLGTSVTNTTYLPYKVGGVNPVSTGANYKMTKYGYAGHLDDPDNPTFDLNWYTDFNYLPYITGETNNNLFEIGYKNQMIEYTDQTARRVKTFVNLTPVDVINIRFCDVFYFEKEYWRLVEIKDFNTSSDINQTTECTFIKIVRANTNELIDYSTFGYLGLAGGTDGGILGGQLNNPIGTGVGPESGDRPKIRIKNGTTIKTISNQKDYFDEINNKNNIKVDISNSGFPVIRPKVIFNPTEIMNTKMSLNETKGVTLQLQDNVDLISSSFVDIKNVYTIDNSESQGFTYVISNEIDRIYLTAGSYTSTTSNCLFSPSLDIKDGYTIDMIPDSSTNFKTRLAFHNLDGERVSKLCTISPTNKVKLTYWSDVDDYVLTNGSVVSSTTETLIYFGGDNSSSKSFYQYDGSTQSENWSKDPFDGTKNTNTIYVDKRGYIYLGGSSNDTYNLKVYNSYGDVLMSKDYNQTIKSIEVDDDGFIYICGFEDPNGVTHRKLSPDGTILWDGKFGDDTYGLTVLGDYVYVVGNYVSSNNIRKYEKDTGLLVDEAFFSTENMYAITKNNEGNLIIGGFWNSGNNVFKITPSLTQVWGYNNNGDITSIAVDSNDNIYIVGEIFIDTSDLRKLNNSGTLQWSYSHGANLHSVFVDKNDVIYIAGESAIGNNAERLNTSGVALGTYLIGTTLNSVFVR